MPTYPPALQSSEPDVTVLEKLATFERIAIAAVITIAVVNLAGWSIPMLGRLFANSWHLMPPESALAVLLSAFSLRLSEPRNPRQMQRMGLILAALVAVLSTCILAAALMYAPPGVDAKIPLRPGFSLFLSVGMSPQSAGAFALLGLTMILMRARKRLSSMAADVVTFALALLVLILVSGHLLAIWHVFGPTEQVGTSSQTMVCLLLLAQAAFFRRAVRGVFSILLGRGLGSRFARVFAPLLLLLPFVREAGRAQFIDSGRMPAHYTTAILASLNGAVALALLLFLAWRINCLETEISDLSLRDELTGLYNLRGFRILAEQSLRMAHRSAEPFSVLFIDLDNLKQTNDELGHQAGSEFLIETAEILNDTFRESDVLGRIGGDEFAVAGQFTQSAIAVAALRLEESAQRRNAEAGREIGLRFSIGHITSETGRHESLDELLAKADEAMYQEKRRRKIPVS